MGHFRGAVFHHGGVPENCPLALMGRFPSLMGRLPSSNSRAEWAVLSNALMGRLPS